MSTSARVGARQEPRPPDGALDDLRAAWRAHPGDRSDLETLARAVIAVRDGLIRQQITEITTEITKEAA